MRVVADPQHPERMVTNATLNMESMAREFDTEGYLTPYSDVAAALVFDHQMRMMNLLTRSVGKCDWHSTSVRTDAARERRRANLLASWWITCCFFEEAPLTGWVYSTSAFDARFAAQGPRDAKRPSLRDLDLGTPPDALPVQLHDLFSGLRCIARAGEVRDLPTHVGKFERRGEIAATSSGAGRNRGDLAARRKRGLPPYFVPPMR